ncbi:hypothetical protein ACSBR2_030604 [Camellia fascicularis]
MGENLPTHGKAPKCLHSLHSTPLRGIEPMTSLGLSPKEGMEYLTLGASCIQLEDIIYQISIHFVGLGVPSAYIGKSDASAIATLLPNIKELDLRCANIEKEYLVMILKGCKELEYVDVSYCEGFDEGDIDILKLASHIHTFKPEG